MKTLNRAAADALRPFEPNAVTDVTGFGLLGHAHELAVRSGVRVVLDAAELPALPGALELAEAGVRTGGDRRNREFAGPHVASTAREAPEALAYDPQTAGGLLISLPADKARRARGDVRRPDLFLRRIGRIEAGAGVVLGQTARTLGARGLGARPRADARGLDRAVPAPRGHRRPLALRRRHDRGRRPPDGVGSRLRQLAAVRLDRRSPRRAATRSSSSATA